MLERIQRVINNHQLSCHHTRRYFYILRGFEPFMDNIVVPLEHDAPELRKEYNRYILEEELEGFDKSRFEGYTLIEVVFNFFENNYMYNGKDFIKLEPLDLDIHDTLCVFNTHDALGEFVEHDPMDNNQRLEHVYDTLKKEYNT